MSARDSGRDRDAHPYSRPAYRRKYRDKGRKSSPPVDNFLKPSINLHIVIEGQRMVHRVVTQINFSEVVLIRSIFADIEDRVWNIQPDRD